MKWEYFTRNMQFELCFVTNVTSLIFSFHSAAPFKCHNIPVCIHRQDEGSRKKGRRIVETIWWYLYKQIAKVNGISWSRTAFNRTEMCLTECSVYPSDLTAVNWNICFGPYEIKTNFHFMNHFHAVQFKCIFSDDFFFAESSVDVDTEPNYLFSLLYIFN